MEILKLNKEVYKKRCIDMVVEVYNGLAEINISDAGNYWYLVFEQCKYGEKRTVKEFENYLIDIENS